MTTIAFKDGVLAADRRACSGWLKLGEVSKIARRESDGALIGGAGRSAQCLAYREWFLAGEQGDQPKLTDLENKDATRILIIRPNGDLETVDPLGVSRFFAPFYAIGSGADYAIGAMAAGKSAEEAVVIASGLDIGTGPDVDALSLRANRHAVAI